MTRTAAKLIIVLIVLTTVLALYFITKLTFDYEFEHFFPTDDPELEFYQEFKEKFDP